MKYIFKTESSFFYELPHFLDYKAIDLILKNNC